MGSNPILPTICSNSQGVLGKQRLYYHHCMRSSNEYMREYMRNLYQRRKIQLIDLLGGKCVKCENTEDLQFDHIDPSTKTEIIPNLMGKNFSKALVEVQKCQLLCIKCHQAKTLIDLKLQDAKNGGFHGTLSTYRYCKCEECREAKRVYMREYDAKRKRQRK